MKCAIAATAWALAGLVAAQQYDYIVAGSGAAGLIVAARLAETGKEVLLVERGHETTASSGGKWAVPWMPSVNYYDVPGLANIIYSKYNEDPQGSPFCTDVPDMAGCVLGGGTEVNMLAFVRPQPADFERWPAGWNSDDMADAEARLYARNPGTIWPSNDGLRYDQGTWNASSKYFENAGWHEANMIERPDRKHKAFSHSAMNVVDGQRAGPVRTYLPLVKNMPNFHMMLNTKVIKANRAGTKITGVQVQQANGQVKDIKIKPSGRVILGAGAMSTPRILWYSGIGRSDVLNSIQQAGKVELPSQGDWIDLPVGESLRNHNQVRIRFQTNKVMPFFDTDAYLNPSQDVVSLYQSGSGLMAQTNERGHFWNSIVLPHSDGRRRFFQGIMIPSSANQIQFQVILSHGSDSMGQLGIDANSGNTVFVQPPKLSTAGDKQAFAKFIDGLIKMGNKRGSPMKFVPEERGQSGAEIVRTAGLGKHYVGSAKMGTDDGRQGGTAVVDPDTKVYGTDNLHVVDGSIHPDLPTGNTQAIIMVAAEQAVAKILALDGRSIASGN